jgi:hypothetical protein
LQVANRSRSERTIHTRFAETSLPNNFGDRRARSAKVPDLLNPLWHQSGLAIKPYATLLCLFDAIHLTLAPVSNSAINAGMPITSLPVRDVVSIEGSSITLKLTPFSASSETIR